MLRLSKQKALLNSGEKETCLYEGKQPLLKHLVSASLYILHPNYQLLHNTLLIRSIKLFSSFFGTKNRTKYQETSWLMTLPKVDSKYHILPLYAVPKRLCGSKGIWTQIMTHHNGENLYTVNWAQQEEVCFLNVI